MESLGNLSSRAQCRLQELVSKSQVLDVNVADERRQLFDLAQSLCSELETPIESIYRLIVT
ncbi:unnamed protein product [Penicillium camemberti]|uniref:Str. FM013 n=1 Tax=Penicillium camemberti (strain FM 013) TaxID=1429867 RepID=A0A0G4P7X3_PENC3|nr:unnamed protein product [Penicillium camemberti]